MLWSGDERSTKQAHCESLACISSIVCVNIYSDAVTADMAEAYGKIVRLVLNGTRRARKAS